METKMDDAGNDLAEALDKLRMLKSAVQHESEAMNIASRLERWDQHTASGIRFEATKQLLSEQAAVVAAIQKRILERGA
jgi:hypothetical protein